MWKTALLPTLAVLLATLLASGYDARKKKATPLADFTAPAAFGRFSIPADNPLTQESVELGRRLFYDPRLSASGKVSCSTCHIQQLAFTDGLATSLVVPGKPLAFNSMSLANQMWGPQHFFWDGRVSTLEEQALIPIQQENEMGHDLGRLVAELSKDPTYRKMFEKAYGEVSATAIGRALASFERTLISANSRYDRFLRGELELNPQEEQGRKLFMAHPDAKVNLRGANCVDCHSQFVTSGFSTRYDGFSNNGLDDEEHLQPGLQTATGNPAHRGLFKVPSLRNIALTGPYMHDGRFKTLEEVMDHYNSGIKKSSTLSSLIVEADNGGAAVAGRISLNLTEAEKAAMIAFLHTLTDEEFVTAERFSDPFARK